MENNYKKVGRTLLSSEHMFLFRLWCTEIGCDRIASDLFQILGAAETLVKKLSPEAVKVWAAVNEIELATKHQFAHVKPERVEQILSWGAKSTFGEWLDGNPIASHPGFLALIHDHAIRNSAKS